MNSDIFKYYIFIIKIILSINRFKFELKNLYLQPFLLIQFFYIIFINFLFFNNNHKNKDNIF